MEGDTLNFDCQETVRRYLCTDAIEVDNRIDSWHRGIFPVRYRSIKQAPEEKEGQLLIPNMNNTQHTVCLTADSCHAHIQ